VRVRSAFIKLKLKSGRRHPELDSGSVDLKEKRASLKVDAE